MQLQRCFIHTMKPSLTISTDIHKFLTQHQHWAGKAAVTLQTCIRVVIDSNPSRTLATLTEISLAFFQFHHENAKTLPQSGLECTSFKSFPIHQSTCHSTFHILDTDRRKNKPQSTLSMEPIKCSDLIWKLTWWYAPASKWKSGDKLNSLIFTFPWHLS